MGAATIHGTYPTIETGLVEITLLKKHHFIGIKQLLSFQIINDATNEKPPLIVILNVVKNLYTIACTQILHYVQNDKMSLRKK